MNEPTDAHDEIAAMRAIAKALQDMPADAQYRVLRWAWSRHVTDPALARLREKDAPPACVPTPDPPPTDPTT